jgi:hypothetical protein
MPRLFASRPLAVAVALSTALVGAVSLSAGSATAAANPHTMSAAQVKAYSAGPTRAVIVELANQHSDLAASSDVGARAAAVGSEQAPFLSELTTVHATRVKSFSLINAFAATVTTAEASHLASEPGVAAVVPDLLV